MVPYRVKVRGRTFLWGGAEVTKKFDNDHLFIHFRVDETGEQIRFGVVKDAGAPLDDFGSLLPGECYTLKLNGIIGVFASLDDPQDTYVDCAIICTGT
jgi:hypothetical protein